MVIYYSSDKIKISQHLNGRNTICKYFDGRGVHNVVSPLQIKKFMNQKNKSTHIKGRMRTSKYKIDISKRHLIMLTGIVFFCIFIMFENVGVFANSANVDDDFAEFEDDPSPIPANVPSLVSKPQAPSQSASNLNQKQYNNIDNTQSRSEKQSNEEQKLPDDFGSDDVLTGGSEKAKKGGLKVITNAPMPKHHTWEAYYIEIMFLVVLVLYFINYYIGSCKNSEIAKSWYDSNRNFLKNNFALVGGQPIGSLNPSGISNDNNATEEKQKKRKNVLIKDTESNYKLWCSGRVGIEGTLIELNLIKRHDVFSMCLYLLRPVRDNLIVRVQLNQDSMDNFVFCIAQRAASVKMFKEMVDIGAYCPERKPISKYGVNSERLHVMTEIREVISYVLDSKISSLITKFEDCIEYIHITDQFSLLRSQEQDLSVPARLSNVRRMATFSFLLPRNLQSNSTNIDSPTNENQDNQQQKILATQQLFQLAFLMIDRLRRFKLSREGKQKSEKNRSKISEILQKAASAQRQEAVQQQKEEQRRLERERVYAEDDVELQRKLEKKEQKRELKRAKVRVKQLRIKSSG